MTVTVTTAVTSEVPRPESRFTRLWRAAELRNVPLRTIVVAVAVVAATYLAGQLIYRIRDIVLLLVVAPTRVGVIGFSTATRTNAAVKA